MTLSLVKSSDVIGMPLTGQEGRKLGTVREMYVDPAAGAVEFLIVEAASLLGGSGKYHPVPSRIVRYDSVDRSLQVDVAKDRFKESPSYDREQLSGASYGWAEQAARFFAESRASDQA
ncbi:MAG TPA: PRC-barrel domain-containing protein [Caulobacteraceae bacterium]|nr:PRC-barrel domain-containing protein [Caulobacteraceae bacterium]